MPMIEDTNDARTATFDDKNAASTAGATESAVEIYTHLVEPVMELYAKVRLPGVDSGVTRTTLISTLEDGLKALGAVKEVYLSHTRTLLARLKAEAG